MRLTPEERAKKTNDLRAARLAAKNAERRELYKKQQEKRAIKEKAQAFEDLKAMNNVRTRSNPKPSKGKPTIGYSASNRKWKNKRHERYNAKTWPGWRDSDGIQSPVITFKKDNDK